jgi:hypothetical protein
MQFRTARPRAPSDNDLDGITTQPSVCTRYHQRLALMSQSWNGREPRAGRTRPDETSLVHPARLGVERFQFTARIAGRNEKQQSCQRESRR